MFIQSTRIAVHGIVALICGNAVALILGFDEGLIMSGLFGYNSFLVGLALSTFDNRADGGNVGDNYYASTIMASIIFAMFSLSYFYVNIWLICQRDLQSYLIMCTNIMLRHMYEYLLL